MPASGSPLVSLSPANDSWEQLLFVVNAVPALIAYVDAEARYVWANETYRRWFGSAADHLRGRHASEVLGPSAWERIKPYVDRALSGEEVTFEDRLVYRSGPARTVQAFYVPHRDSSGAVCGFVGLVNDITEMRTTELALRRTEHMLGLSQERYRSLVGAITSVVWTADLEGKFVEPQPAWEAYTGQPWEQHKGWGWTLALHADDRERVAQLTTDAGRTGILDRSPCRVWHAPSAVYRLCERSAVATRNVDGTIREWIGTLVDEHDREQALQELREADRRKDEFLAMLSHELRNPLAPILHAVEMLNRTEPDGDGPGADYRKIIVRQVQHMKRLLDDLFDVSRVSQGKIQLRKEPVELATLMRQAIEVSRPLILEKQQHLSMMSVQQPMPLRADPTRLVQVFANLVNNAAKYTDRGGQISVDMTIENRDAVVKVRDDGAGMSADLLARAFDLFVQETRSLDRAQGGLGIGLTLVRALVKMHGGSVRAHSEGPGRGSELVVRLPLSDAPELAVPRPTVSTAEAIGRPLRVLVVDDNDDAAHILAVLFEQAGHAVTLAYDGPGALAAAAAARPELVILDLGLPGMDGYTVAARLRDTGHDQATLVALTGYGQDEDRHRSRAAGFDHHLVKPIDFAVLEKIAAEAASESRALPAEQIAPSARAAGGR